jgi:hypothetical protein
MALVLGVLIVAVVGIARAVSGPLTVESIGPPAPIVPSLTASPELGDDSVATSESPPTPSSIPGAPPPETVALDFTRAWLNSKDVTSAQWLKGLEPYATPRLLGELKDADPATVPADAVRGPVQVRARDSLLAEVTVPVNPGNLRLRLLVTDGRWLVDGVDWERP